jgi:hypothetical protein
MGRGRTVHLEPAKNIPPIKRTRCEDAHKSRILNAMLASGLIAVTPLGAPFGGLGLAGRVFGGSPISLDHLVQLDRIKQVGGYGVVAAALRRWLRRG